MYIYIGKIYCSSTTAKLCHFRLKIPLNCLYPLPLNIEHTIYRNNTNTNNSSNSDINNSDNINTNNSSSNNTNNKNNSTNSTTGKSNTNNNQSDTASSSNSKVVCYITFFDANHCPGAVVAIIRFPGSAKIYFHTGRCVRTYIFIHLF